jgi:hypothetical protein
MVGGSAEPMKVVQQQRGEIGWAFAGKDCADESVVKA